MEQSNSLLSSLCLSLSLSLFLILPSQPWFSLTEDSMKRKEKEEESCPAERQKNSSAAHVGAALPTDSFGLDFPDLQQKEHGPCAVVDHASIHGHAILSAIGSRMESKLAVKNIASSLPINQNMQMLQSKHIRSHRRHFPPQVQQKLVLCQQ
jgi:hypothetical protein